MSLVSLRRLRTFSDQVAFEKVIGILDPCLKALLPRADASTFGEVRLARRGMSSNNRKTIILSTILGSAGCIALVLAIFLLARYFMLRQPAGEDLPLEEATTDVYNKQEKQLQQKPPVPPPPTQPFPRPRRPQTPVRAYIPNHPYALSYARPDSVSTHPSAPPVLPAAESVPTPPRPLPPSPPTLYPLVVPRLPHPYSQQQSAGAGSMNYESFMLPETPENAPDSMQMSSPLPSSIGLTYPPSAFELGLSSDEPTSASAFSRTSSTAPLNGSGDQHQRSFRLS